MAKSIKQDTDGFFESLMAASSGFYFIDADDPTESLNLRGTDFRSGHPKGICLVLACTFDTESDYLQAKGRVGRSDDEGVVFELQEDMYKDDN